LVNDGPSIYSRLFESNEYFVENSEGIGMWDYGIFATGNEEY